MPLPITILSTKGQLILPKPVRDSRRWPPGTRLSVEETPEGVLLRAVQDRPFPATTVEEVFGMLGYDGPAVTEDDMERAIGEEIRDRMDRGRY